MKKLQQHWRGMAVLAVILVLAGSMVWRDWGGGPALAAEGGEGYDPISQGDHDAIVALLDYVSLDQDSLIALNVSGQQAEDLLAAARTWYQNNHATLATRQATIDTKLHALRELKREIALGPYDPSHAQGLALARQELATARAAFRTTVTPAQAGLGEEMSQSQLATWTAIQSGHGQRMPIRMLALSDDQRLALSRAQRSYEWRHAAATTAEERSAALSTWETALEDILTQDQETIVASYYSNYADASEAVTEAFGTVLPVTDEG